MPSAPAMRLATLVDVPILADAWYAMMDEAGLLVNPVDPNWRTYILSDFRAAIALGSQVWIVVEDEGQIAATGAAFFRGGRATISLTGLSATLAGVYTFPAFRRRGFARAVVGRLIELCRTKGCHSIRLRASEQGRPLYEQFGFVSSDEMVLPL